MTVVSKSIISSPKVKWLFIFLIIFSFAYFYFIRFLALYLFSQLNKAIIKFKRIRKPRKIIIVRSFPKFVSFYRKNMFLGRRYSKVIKGLDLAKISPFGILIAFWLGRKVVFAVLLAILKCLMCCFEDFLIRESSLRGLLFAVIQQIFFYGDHAKVPDCC